MRRPMVLLVNPWIHDFAAYDLWARPMGLLVLATLLRRHGWDCLFLDCLDRDHPAMEAVKIKRHGHGPLPRQSIEAPEALAHVPRRYSRFGVPPDLIGKDLESLPTPDAILVTSLMTYWYRGVEETVLLLKDHFPDTPLILGGIYATLLPHHARAISRADLVLTGPGEQAIFDVLSRLTGHPPSPEPDRSHFEFTPALDLLRKVRFIPVLTSRGCPFGCSYCASSLLAPRMVKRSSEEVIHEIVENVHRYDVSDIALYDDAFLVDAAGHALPILERLAERVPGLRLHSPNGLHARAIDRRLAAAMKRAGFETIRLGLESSSDAFHEETGQKTRVSDFLRAVANLRAEGFTHRQIGAYLLVGIPGQTREQIEEDVALVMEAGALPKLAEYSPIPGTLMWEDAVESSPYPIEQEPLYHNCTLLPAAHPSVDRSFLQDIRRRISDHFTGNESEQAEV